MLAPEIVVEMNAGMTEILRNRSEVLLWFFFLFEESLMLECQKAQLGAKYHLLLVTETA